MVVRWAWWFVSCAWALDSGPLTSRRVVKKDPCARAPVRRGRRLLGSRLFFEGRGRGGPSPSPSPSPGPSASSEMVVALSDETVAVGEDGGVVLFEELSLSIRAGEHWCILGGNGAGKSVLAQLLGRRVAPPAPEELEGSVAQLRALGRRDLEHLGFDEWRHADAARKTAAAPQEEAKRAVGPSSAIPSSASTKPSERGVTVISFESQRRLLLDEVTEFEESRFGAVHKRATAASYLFPELYPTDPAQATTGSSPAAGYRPRRTRVAPLPVAFDADGGDPLLGHLEAACSRGRARALLDRFGLYGLRHRPIYALSTGELRKLMVVDALLSPSKLTVFDEVCEGLDARSRDELHDSLRDFDQEHEAAEGKKKMMMTLISVVHRAEDLAMMEPTHAIILGQGSTMAAAGQDASRAVVGRWADLAATCHGLVALDDALGASGAADTPSSSLMPARPDGKTVGRAPEQQQQQQRRRRKDAAEEARRTRAPLVEFRDVTVAYGSSVVLDSLTWSVRAGELWAVVGPNGAGKSTILELITGVNPLGYGQDIALFGRQKGSGESIWDVRRDLGALSTASHMAYTDFCDAAVRTQGGNGARVTSWEVVLSGFFDSIGLYDAPSREHEAVARDWVDRLGVGDLVESTRPFFTLSHGQQKLVLLCRAMVKSPRLLLLDEPTHGLSAPVRDRLFKMLATISQAPDVALVYVTHRRDEIDALGFDNVLRLTVPARR